MLPTTCLNSRLVKNRYSGDLINSTCGECLDCRMVRQMQLCQQFDQASIKHKYTFFVTLTFDNAHLTRKTSADLLRDFAAARRQGSIKNDETFDKMVESALSKDVFYYSPKDVLQRFFKRLRINVQRKYKGKLQYYSVLEYGHKKTRNYRPHYHCLIWTDCDQFAWHYKSDIHKAWSYGFTCSELAYSAGKYASKYVTFRDNLPPVYWSGSPLEPYCLFSQRPAISSIQIGTPEFERLLFDGSDKYTFKGAFTKEFSYSKQAVSSVFPRYTGFRNLTYKERVRFDNLFNIVQERYGNIYNFLRLNHVDRTSRWWSSWIQDYYRSKKVCFIKTFYRLSDSDFDKLRSNFYFNLEQSRLKNQYIVQETNIDKRYHLSLYHLSSNLHKSLDNALSRYYLAQFGFNPPPPPDYDPGLIKYHSFLKNIDLFSSKHNADYLIFHENNARIFLRQRIVKCFSGNLSEKSNMYRKLYLSPYSFAS